MLVPFQADSPSLGQDGVNSSRLLHPNFSTGLEVENGPSVLGLPSKSPRFISE